MDFEFDPAKSEANKAKHGIDFSEATRLWEDESRIEIPARTMRCSCMKVKAGKFDQEFDQSISRCG